MAIYANENGSVTNLTNNGLHCVFSSIYAYSNDLNNRENSVDVQLDFDPAIILMRDSSALTTIWIEPPFDNEYISSDTYYHFFIKYDSTNKILHIYAKSIGNSSRIDRKFAILG